MTSPVAKKKPILKPQKPSLANDVRLPPTVRPAGPVQSAVAGNAAKAPPVPAPGGIGAYTRLNTNVAAQIGQVIAKGGPLMQLARAEGDKIANRRGLLSSSIAAGTAENEVLKAATPIGSQQAQQNAAWNTNLSQISLADRQQIRDIAAKQGLQAADIAAQQKLQETQIAADKAIRLLDRDTQTKLAELQLGAADRAQLAQVMANYQGVYAERVNAIQANKLLKPEARAQALADLRAERENFIKFNADLYDVDISWGTPAPMRPQTPPPAGGIGGGTAPPAARPPVARPTAPPPRGYADSTGWHNL